MSSFPHHSVPAARRSPRGSPSPTRHQRRAGRDTTSKSRWFRASASGLFPDVRLRFPLRSAVHQKAIIASEIGQFLASCIAPLRVVYLRRSTCKNDLALVCVVFGVLAVADTLPVRNELHDLDFAIPERMMDTRIGI